MILYKFYLRDGIKGDIFLGTLPERRKNPRRITEETTEESLRNWGRKYFGMKCKDEDIFFIKTVLEERRETEPPFSPP